MLTRENIRLIARSSFDGREAKGLSKGRYDETFAGEDELHCA